VNLPRLLRLTLGILIAAAISTVVQSQVRGGGGGGGGGQRGGAPAGGGQRAPGGPATARGAAGANRGAARGERRGQTQEQKQKEELEPDNGLVTAYVTVTTKDHRAVPGLTRSNFQVFEDNVEQKLEAFSVESGPTTVGFVVGGDPSDFRDIAPAFLKATPWEDEYFVIVDTGHPPGGTVIQAFTTDTMKVPKNFQIGGVTADSIYVGLDYLKEAANRRKLLLLFGGSLNADPDFPATQGLDPDYVVRMATKEQVQTYSILTNNDGGTTFDDAGTSDIVPLTGGRAYTTFASSGSLETIAEEIAKGIGVQYLIGYHTTNEAKDGKFRRIKVVVNNAPEELGKLTVWSRSGYYAVKQKKAKS
jgi:VWFA-related protein